MIDEAILAAMHRSFGNAIKKIWMPRLSRSLTFREPNVGEQKTFSKIVLANPDSHSIVYGASLALIKKLALDRDFSGIQLNEMERIVILANLFSTNFLTKQIAVTCPNKECGHKFVQTIKHGELLRNLDGIDASDYVYENVTPIGRVKAYINYPSTKKYLEFLEYIEDRQSASRLNGAAENATDRYEQLDHAFDDISPNSANPISSSNKQDGKIAAMIERRKAKLKSSATPKAAGNIDLGQLNARYVGLNSVDLYIRRLEWKVNGDDTDYEVTFDDSINFEETERILGGFPAAFFTDSNGETITEAIANELYRRVNSTVPTVKCPKCGLDITKDVNLYDFFTVG